MPSIKDLLTFLYDVAVVLAAILGFVLIGYVVREWWHAEPNAALSLALFAIACGLGLGLRRLLAVLG